MKISSLTLGCATLALAAGSAFANVTPNLQDSSGAAVKDGLSARQQQRVEPADVRHVPSDRPDLEQRQSDRV